MKFKSIILVMLGCLILSSCQTDEQLKNKMSKIIKENPEILIKAIEAKPVEFVEAFQAAVKNAQGALAKKKKTTR